MAILEVMAAPQPPSDNTQWSLTNMP
jgi:hypothetical protein